MYLRHVTASHLLESIASEGIRPGAYLLNTDDLESYYLETVQDEGHEAVILAVDLSTLDKKALKPDQPGIDEPITSAIGMDEDEVWEAWEETKRKDWQACLELIGSVMYAKAIPPELILVCEGDDMRPLIDPAPKP